MSDYMAAEIWIGSTLSPRLVEPLCQAICGENLSLEWGDISFQPSTGKELLNARTPTDGAPLLRLCDDQARWGAFEELEEFLVEHDVSFRRRTEGKWEYDPEVIEFRPGIGRLWFPTNSSGELVGPLSTLCALDESLTRLVTPSASPISSQEPVEQLQTIRQELGEHLPPVIPDLEPFEIGGT